MTGLVVRNPSRQRGQRCESCVPEHEAPSAFDVTAVDSLLRTMETSPSSSVSCHLTPQWSVHCSNGGHSLEESSQAGDVGYMKERVKTSTCSPSRPPVMLAYRFSKSAPLRFTDWMLFLLLVLSSRCLCSSLLLLAASATSSAGKEAFAVSVRSQEAEFGARHRTKLHFRRFSLQLQKNRPVQTASDRDDVVVEARSRTEQETPAMKYIFQCFQFQS